MTIQDFISNIKNLSNENLQVLIEKSKKLGISEQQVKEALNFINYIKNQKN